MVYGRLNYPEGGGGGGGGGTRSVLPRYVDSTFTDVRHLSEHETQKGDLGGSSSVLLYVHKKEKEKKKSEKRGLLGGLSHPRMATSTFTQLLDSNFGGKIFGDKFCPYGRVWMKGGWKARLGEWRRQWRRTADSSVSEQNGFKASSTVNRGLTWLSIQ